jgi:hypothetical protein
MTDNTGMLGSFLTASLTIMGTRVRSRAPVTA